MAKRGTVEVDAETLGLLLFGETAVKIVDLEFTRDAQGNLGALLVLEGEALPEAPADDPEPLFDCHVHVSRENGETKRRYRFERVPERLPAAHQPES